MNEKHHVSVFFNETPVSVWSGSENDISFVFVFSEELERDVEFEVVGEAPDKAPPPQSNKEEVNSITNGNKDSAQPSTSSKGQQEEKPV